MPQYLEDWLEHGLTEVAVSALRLGTASYQITIVKGLDGDKKWRFEKSWLHVQNFHGVLGREDNVPAAKFLGWNDGYGHPSKEDSPLVVAALFQHAFAHLFQTFSGSFLSILKSSISYGLR